MDRNQELVMEFHDKFGATIGAHPELRDTRLAGLLIMEEAVETVAAMGFTVHAHVDFHEPGNPASQTAKEDPSQTVVEFFDQYQTPNFNEVIDGLADLVYVTLGAAIRFGIDLQPFFEEVHKTNMAKEGGKTRADGKVLKPEGWQPPDIDRILLHQQLDADVWREMERQAIEEPFVEVIAPTGESSWGTKTEEWSKAEVNHERLENGEAVA